MFGIPGSDWKWSTQPEKSVVDIDLKNYAFGFPDILPMHLIREWQLFVVEKWLGDGS